MTMTAVERATAIAHLNDRARLGLDRNARIVITASCLATFSDGNAISAIVDQAEILKAVRKHAFANDAYGERDFGVLELRDTQIMFKIDYYDVDLQYGSEDPADASQTLRVVTIMLPQDY